MKPAVLQRTVLSSGSQNLASFGFSDNPEDVATMARILREAIYTNPILAVLREYSANAWDAHQEVGKSDLPIKVVLPTSLESSVVIRDYGPGLSEESIRTVYVKYGISTKRETNTKVGMYGIGCKSAFAYNDSFTITSWHGGKKMLFHAVLDETDVGALFKMHEEECDLSETGIEIKVPVNPGDIPNFKREADRLYRYFLPLPDINITLAVPDFKWKTENGFLRRNARAERYADQWQAVMGCVPYRLNMDQIWPELCQLHLNGAVQALSGGLYFELGSIDIAANREDLRYTDNTKKVIIARFRTVLGELVSKLVSIADNESLSGWDRRLQVRDFLAATGIGLVGDAVHHFVREVSGSDSGTQEWVKPRVQLYKRAVVFESSSDPAEDEDEDVAPKLFSVHKLRVGGVGGNGRFLEENRSINVNKDTRLLLWDTPKSCKGYAGHSDYVIRLSNDGRGRGLLSPAELLTTATKAEQELNRYLKEASLDGIPILRMSEMEYQSYSMKNGSTFNVKHKEKCFTYLKGFIGTKGVRSENWKGAERTPLPTDVYVVISRFVPEGHPQLSERGSFRDVVRDDTNFLATLFQMEMPEIWGLKSTAKNPLRREDIVGIPYETWLDNTIQEQLEAHPEVAALVNRRYWSHLQVGERRYGRSKKDVPSIVRYLKKNLDGRHMLVRFFRDLERGRVVTGYRLTKALDALVHARGLAVTSPQKRRDAVYKRYPLLNSNHYGLGVFFWEVHLEDWLDYVKLVDTHRLKGA